jgi:hypothetical protein
MWQGAEYLTPSAFMCNMQVISNTQQPQQDLGLLDVQVPHRLAAVPLHPNKRKRNTCGSKHMPATDDEVSGRLLSTAFQLSHLWAIVKGSGRTIVMVCGPLQSLQVGFSVSGCYDMKVVIGSDSGSNQTCCLQG